ncbi:hypothetical protein [Xanthomonas campestris]|uniref:hypothetical protein n=1 Tax=Xanthomonas campestris TaxID=339 RepID=UPI002B22D727|nr:hypothetical protein [Xanthomonas campestris]MEA9921501.1 hypothetical protein [Xanthomonas campestris pv. raphani]
MEDIPWQELEAAASPNSALDVHIYVSSLLLQLGRDSQRLPSEVVFRSNERALDGRFLDLAARALKVADGLRARALRTEKYSSAVNRQLAEVLQKVQSLFARQGMARPQAILDRYRFNEAALDWMDTLEIHPAGPGGALLWTYKRKLLLYEEIHKRLQSNEALLKEMLSPRSEDGSMDIPMSEWVFMTRHWQSLHRDWVPTLEKWCLQSASVSGELEPAL